MTARTALLVGRFHAVTQAQARWLEGLKTADVGQVVCVLTSADHAGTRRNPLDAATREAMLRPALERTGLPLVVVRLDDVPDSADWVEHVVRGVRAAGQELKTRTTSVYTSNRDVAALFEARGFGVVGGAVEGLTPSELLERVVEGRPWESEASPETRAVLGRPEVVARLRAIYGQRLVNDDGELGHARDFASYGAQMDASLRQKLDDILPWVKPGLVVDKGCGTGALLVELSRRFPTSALVGVDLSREFLRRCDENTYATDDVTLTFGDIIERNVEPGTATTVIYSSVMHEVYSYSGYDRGKIEKALTNAHAELQPGGQVVIRDGVSPPPASWHLRLLDEATRWSFERFSKEFRHGAGAPSQRLAGDEVIISSHLANEFLCKKDYQKNWHIEVHEEYGAHTLEEWGEVLTRCGFEPVHGHEYVNQWIAENRYQGHVDLTDELGQPLPWPATNCVVAGKKA
jgi:SAM-dependent methyltransferase/nicotinamide mononucleotide adenylyltransferase